VTITAESSCESASAVSLQVHVRALTSSPHLLAADGVLSKVDDVPVVQSSSTAKANADEETTRRGQQKSSGSVQVLCEPKHGQLEAHSA
jgi:hypothetical protein